MTADAYLTEQIARALATEEGYELPWEQERHAGLYRERAAAVLPIVRKAERDAAREALDGLADHSDARDGDGVRGRLGGIIRTWRDARYPEETP